MSGKRHKQAGTDLKYLVGNIVRPEAADPWRYEGFIETHFLVLSRLGSADLL